MKNYNIRIIWEEFIKKYNLNNYDIWDNNYDIWDNNLEKVKLYIQQYKCKPLYYSKDNNIKKLSRWIINQQNNYNVNIVTNFLYINSPNIMNKNIQNKWMDFINEYKEYFLNIEDTWDNNLEQVKTYIKKYNCKPAEKSKDINIKHLGCWIKTQQVNYKNNKKNMKNNNIKIKWEEFINEYKEYFLSTDEIWNNNLEQVKIYIKEHNCKPSQNNKNNKIKYLGLWINIQQKNYKNNKFNMKNNNIKNKWKKIID